MTWHSMTWHSLLRSDQDLTKHTPSQIPKPNVPGSSVGVEAAQAAVAVEGQKAEEDEQR